MFANALNQLWHYSVSDDEEGEEEEGEDEGEEGE